LVPLALSLPLFEELDNGILHSFQGAAAFLAEFFEPLGLGEGGRCLCEIYPVDHNRVVHLLSSVSDRFLRDIPEQKHSG